MWDGGGGVIAGQQHHPHAKGAHRGNRGLAGRLHNVGYPDHAGRVAVKRKVERGDPLVCHRTAGCAQVVGRAHWVMINSSLPPAMTLPATLPVRALAGDWP